MRLFFDTNILVYAQQVGPKAERANDLLASGGLVSVQVANELVNVLRKKLGRNWSEIEAVLDDVRHALGEPRPLTFVTHVAALSLARDHGLSFYDALIVAAAIEAECDILISEDMQHGRAFGSLVVQNPFL